MAIKHWQDPLNFILGLWVIVSPWVMGYQAHTAATPNAVLLGFVIAVMALVALFRGKAWEEWLNLLFGLWLVISPWVLGFSGHYPAMWNAVIVGAIVAILALWTVGTDKDMGGWWGLKA